MLSWKHKRSGQQEVTINTLIASKIVDGEVLHFILVDECFSDDDEPFTLFVHANHHTSERTERARKFFHTQEDALRYCQGEYSIAEDQWKSEERFARDFQFEYGITCLGVVMPYAFGFENGKVIFRLNEREVEDGETLSKETVLNICGNREGLQRLAAMLLLCADGERYSNIMHIHLEDEEGFILPDVPVTLRSPSYFEALVHDDLREGTTGTKIIFTEE